MTGCCDPRGADEVFTARYARKSARKLRTSGLDDTATRMVEYLVAGGLEGASILEIGGGVGGLHTELLRRGAATATNLELSSSYESEASQMLVEAGLDDRVDRRLVNIANQPEEVEPADVVVLHRVVCCYYDYVGLLGAAADHARRMLVFSYPRPHTLTRALTSLENVGYALRGQDFRTFVHSPDAMLEVLADHGHQVMNDGHSAMWNYTVTARRT
jgi:magnesium-protoporphyrin O-methyltransferase